MSLSKALIVTTFAVLNGGCTGDIGAGSDDLGDQSSGTTGQPLTAAFWDTEGAARMVGISKAPNTQHDYAWDLDGDVCHGDAMVDFCKYRTFYTAPNNRCHFAAPCRHMICSIMPPEG